MRVERIYLLYLIHSLLQIRDDSTVMAYTFIAPFIQDCAETLNLCGSLQRKLFFLPKQGAAFTLFLSSVKKEKKGYGQKATLSHRSRTRERWHWPRRPHNWPGATESRDPASLTMMRSWDWGAGGQPVSHDLGPSIKVARRINLN